MKNKKLYLLILSAILGPSFIISSAYAQGAENVDCFDYYKFQSVQVSLGTDKDVYNLGETVNFHGKLINQNNYPIVNGYVFARIGVKNSNYTKEGNFTINEAIPLDNINLAPNETKDVQFSWKVPEQAINGNYRADFFFSVGKKFNLGGLPFTNEVVGGATEFAVKSENTSFISFDKSATTVNGEKYNHVGNWPNVNLGDKVEIIQPIKNTYNTEKDVKVQYDLYFWDSLNEQDKISSKTDDLKIPASGSANASYVIPQMNDSVYLLKITTAGDSGKSIINLRVVSDQEHPRLNFPALTKFPLQKGEKTTVFACFHNTSSLDTKGKVNIILTDKTGKEVGRMDYSGGITSAMMASKTDIQVQSTYDWLKINAILTDKNGNLVDKYETVYDCSLIDSGECKALMAKTVTPITGRSNNIVKMFIFVVLFLAVVFVLIILKRKIISKTLIIFLSLLVSMILFASFSHKASAYNDQTSTTSSGSFKHTDNKGFCYFNLIASVLHRIGMTVGDLTVKVGDQINFAYNPDLPFFSGTGGDFDTPYGAWCNNLSSNCGGDYIQHNVGSVTYCRDWFNAAKPVISLGSNNPSVIQCSGMNCNAVGAGTAVIMASIGAVSGRSWIVGHFMCGGTPLVPILCDEDRGYKDVSLPASSMSWTISVNTPAPPTCSVSFSPGSISAPGNSTATVTMSNTTSATYGCTGPQPAPSGSALGVAASKDYTFSFTAAQTGTERCTVSVSGPGGTTSCSGSVIVAPTCTPSCGAWGACSKSCGGGTQSQSCTRANCSTYTNSQACNTQACNQNPIGGVDGGSCSGGIITTWGWALDRDALSTSIPVQFYEGATYKGQCATNVFLSGINSTYGATGNHGFSCAISGFSAGNHTLTVYGINTPAGTNPALPWGTNPITINCPAAVCNLPWGGTIANGASVTAYQNNSVPCGSSCVSQTRTCNNGTLSGSYTNQSCSVAACNKDPIGGVEGGSCSGGIITTWGWAFDLDDSSSSINVQLYEGANYRGQCATSMLRSDINSTYGITGNHGFGCSKSGFSAGNHNFTVLGVNTPAGTNPALSGGNPITINCPAAVCTGAIPANATICSNDNIGLVANTPITLVGACGLLKCEYICNSGFHLSGGICQADCAAGCGAFSACSAPCGGGTYSRTCTLADCTIYSNTQVCNTQACQTNTNWKEVAP